MQTNSENIIQELIETGMQRIPFQSKVDLVTLMDGFKSLTLIPKQARKQWMFWRKENDDYDEPDDGLMERSRHQGKDEKFYFHYRPLLVNQLACRGVNYNEHLEFLQKCSVLYNELKITTENIVYQLDKQFPGYNFLHRMHRRPEHQRHMMRLLLYKPGYQTMAKIHNDRSLLTLAVAESRPGLRFNTDDLLYNPTKGKILAFTGIKAKLLTNGKLKSMPHYVTNESIDEWRWAIVFFSHCVIEHTEQEIRELAKSYNIN